MLRANTGLKSEATLKRSSLKPISKTKRNNKVAYWSIFTDRMDMCYITRDTKNVDPHHIFGASRKHLSEKYGFMLPLRRDWHETANYSIHRDRQFELKMKIKCQDYYINILHKTKEEWIEEFGKWWEISKTG